MDDGAIDEEDNDEDDALLTLSGSHKCCPLPCVLKMSRFHTATYGAIGPLWFGKGDENIAQCAKGIEQRENDDTGNFTQVRVAARRKTLLLLWWINEWTMVEMRLSSPTRLPWGREQLRAYECTRVRIICNVATTLVLKVKGSPQWQNGHYALIRQPQCNHT